MGQQPTNEILSLATSVIMAWTLQVLPQATISGFSLPQLALRLQFMIKLVGVVVVPRLILIIPRAEAPVWDSEPEAGDKIHSGKLPNRSEMLNTMIKIGEAPTEYLNASSHRGISTANTAPVSLPTGSETRIRYDANNG